eukprot:10674960-Prorocentrum_lima.AAC.1
MAKLAELLVHKCSSYCGGTTLKACRFGFPHGPQKRTRLRTAQEQWTTRTKSTLAVRRRECATLMGQYNASILRKWRGSMDLQAICEAGHACKYILGYTFKNEQDATTARRVEQ